MDFEVATRRYLDLRKRLIARELSQEEFEQNVGELIVELADGSRWRIAQDGVGWLKWDGDAWVSGRLPTSVKPAVSSPAAQALAGFDPPARPQSLQQLLTMIVSAMTGQMIIRRMIVVLVAAFLGVWVFNAYLMTKLNPGGLVGVLMTVFAAKANVVTKTVLWFILGAFATATFTRIRRDGWGRYTGDLAGTAQLNSEAVRLAGRPGAAWLAGGAAMALLGCTIVGGRLTALTLAVWAYATLSLGNRSMLFLVTWLVWRELGGRLGGRFAEPLEPYRAFAGMIGLCAGCALAFVMPWMPRSGLVLSAGLFLGSLVVCMALGVSHSAGKGVNRKGGVRK